LVVVVFKGRQAHRNMHAHAMYEYAR